MLPKEFDDPAPSDKCSRLTYVNSKSDNQPGRPMADDSNQNTCVICLEDLSAGVIGAAIPCGHCFHLGCFEGWRASAVGRSHSTLAEVKCPTCNKGARNFCRIYIDLEHRYPADDDDDASSSDDDEQDDDEQDETDLSPLQNDGDETDGRTDAPTHGALVNPPQTHVNQPLATGSSVEVVEIDSDNDQDDVPSPPHPPPPPPAQQSGLASTQLSSATTSSGSLSRDKKYKFKAKLLKKRVSMVELQRSQQAQESKTLLDKYTAKREELKIRDAEYDELLKEWEKLEREHEGLSLEVVQLRRKKTELSSTLESTTTEKENAVRKLNNMRKDHARELQRVQANSMKEVQHILSDHPKLTQENKRLKELLEQAKSMMKESLKRQRSKDASKPSQPPRPAPPSHPQHRSQSSSRDAFKAVYQLSKLDVHHAAQLSQKKKEIEEERKAPGTADLHGKLSAHALRFSKPEKKTHCSDLLQLLDQRDRENSDEGQNKRPAQHQSQLPLAWKRPKPSVGNLALSKGRIR